MELGLIGRPTAAAPLIAFMIPLPTPGRARGFKGDKAPEPRAGACVTGGRGELKPDGDDASPVTRLRWDGRPPCIVPDAAPDVE